MQQAIDYVLGQGVCVCGGAGCIKPMGMRLSATQGTWVSSHVVSEAVPHVSILCCWGHAGLCCIIVHVGFLPLAVYRCCALCQGRHAKLLAGPVLERALPATPPNYHVASASFCAGPWATLGAAWHMSAARGSYPGSNGLNRTCTAGRDGARLWVVGVATYKCMCVECLNQLWMSNGVSRSLRSCCHEARTSRLDHVAPAHNQLSVHAAQQQITGWACLE